MPREQGSGEQGSGEAAEGRDGGGRGDDWRRIETEQDYRDAIGRKRDATHDPSPEFENSAMPLGPDYGRDRPKHREYTPEQQAELEATFGRPIEELMVLRDQDPRAGHSRDDQGRILDADGNPREFVDPREQLLEEQAPPGRTAPEQSRAGSERQDGPAAQTVRTTTDATDGTTKPAADKDGPTPDEEATDRLGDLQAPSDEPSEPDDGETKDGGPVEPAAHLDTAATTSAELEQPADEPSEPEVPHDLDLGKLTTQLATDLRSGKLTPQQAAEQLEAFRDDLPAATIESTTETVRTEPTPDGDLYYQRGTPEGIDDQPGDRTANEESNKVSDRERNRNTLVEGTSNLLEDVEKIVDTAEKGLPPRLPPGTHGETTVRQPDVPTFETRQPDSPDAGNVIAGMLAASVAVIVIWGKATKRSRE